MREVPAAPGDPSRWRPVTCLCWFSPSCSRRPGRQPRGPHKATHSRELGERLCTRDLVSWRRASGYARAGGAVACRGDLTGRVLPSFCPFRPPARRSSSLSSCCHTHSTPFSFLCTPTPAPQFPALACCQLKAEFASRLRERRAERPLGGRRAWAPCVRETVRGAGRGVSDPGAPFWGRGRGASG